MDITPALLASLNLTRKQFDAKAAAMAALVSSSEKLTLAACVRMHQHQTRRERDVRRTLEDNGVGFQEMDAKFGGRMVDLLNSGKAPCGFEMARLRRMAVKYRRQLVVLAVRKEQAKAAKAGLLALDLLDRRAAVKERLAA